MEKTIDIELRYVFTPITFLKKRMLPYNLGHPLLIYLIGICFVTGLLGLVFGISRVRIPFSSLA